MTGEHEGWTESRFGASRFRNHSENRPDFSFLLAITLFSTNLVRSPTYHFHALPDRRVDLHPPKPADFENAVKSLLQPPYREFILVLKHKLDEDPEYLFFHESSVGIKIQSMLRRAGYDWDQATMQHHWARVLRVAFDKLG